jgi:hypothetical protein
LGFSQYWLSEWGSGFESRQLVFDMIGHFQVHGSMERNIRLAFP